ncbi:MAG: phosphoglycolate phosphatase [Shewanella sp.]|nr:phosphoglycolate phosphatase [Shewanella sp.]MCF1432136.1 phosphoglycolate phosphatase [Shewanella sp.]MCF1439143.1 phosphoglycolate phosphatase [Shewanella sp.]MCF1457556.1 phosphoglycolate phosphatase [Shewanella sp.]
MKFSGIKAIAFDLDGTLIDSVPDLAIATGLTLASQGLPECTEDQVRTWVGNGARTLLRRALTWAQGAAVSDDELDRVMQDFMQYYSQYLEQHSRLYSGVTDVLQAFKARSLPLALVTNKPYRFTEPLLRGFDIDKYFDLVLGGDSLPEMKPSPLPLVHVMEHFKINADELLMVGDSRNDILAAKAAGAMSIGLTYGYNYGEDIGLCGPDAVCDHFLEILAMVVPRQAVLELELR